MRQLLGIAVMALAGCGAPFHAEQTCAVGGATLMLEQPGDCAYYAAVVEDARATFSTMGIASDEEVSRILSERIVWVHRTNGFFECNGQTANGCESGDIQVEASAASLVHEMLHALYEDRGVPMSRNQAHWNWGENGALSHAPEFQTVDLTGAVHAYYPGSWWDVADCAWNDWFNIYADGAPWKRSAYYTAP